MISDDESVPEKSAISQWGKFFEEGGKKMGRSFLVIQEGTQRKAMEKAGFVDIQEWEFKVCTTCVAPAYLRLVNHVLPNADFAPRRPRLAVGPWTKN